LEGAGDDFGGAGGAVVDEDGDLGCGCLAASGGRVVFAVAAGGAFRKDEAAVEEGGGDVDAGSLVTEEYLMALERKHFCALLEHPKTQERIMGMLSTGKPVRN